MIVKPALRLAFTKSRCLIGADGFYEWKKTGSTKQPFFVRLKDDEPFAFAGLPDMPAVVHRLQSGTGKLKVRPMISQQGCAPKEKEGDRQKAAMGMGCSLALEPFRRRAIELSDRFKTTLL